MRISVLLMFALGSLLVACGGAQPQAESTWETQTTEEEPAPTYDDRDDADLDGTDDTW